jgi:hypothetical protein
MVLWILANATGLDSPVAWLAAIAAYLALLLTGMGILMRYRQNCQLGYDEKGRD